MKTQTIFEWMKSCGWSSIGNSDSRFQRMQLSGHYEFATGEEIQEKYDFIHNSSKKSPLRQNSGLNIGDVMLDLFLKFGWIVKTGGEQKNGSSADIYAEHNDENSKYTMRIDDGNCHNELHDAVYHIYATGGKVFEGRIGTPEDFVVVMRVLGFDKINRGDWMRRQKN